MINLNNKKAGEKILSLWWFAVLAIVGVGIIAGTLMFYSKDIDVRGIEADIISDKIMDCLANRGNINQDFLDGSFDIFDKCYLDKDILASEQGLYYIKISVSGAGVNFEPKRFGNFGLEEDCSIQEKTNSKYFARCSEKNVLVLDNQKNKLKLSILTGSNYFGGEIDVYKD